MQRNITGNLLSSTNKSTEKRLTHCNKKLAFAMLTAGLLSLTGCQTIKGLTGAGDDDVVTSAKKPYTQYYEDAMVALDEGHYLDAVEQLSELRVFYPTGPYAEDALLNLMYAQYQTDEYAAAAASAEQFIKLYPRNIQVDYAYYVRGVANMQSGSSALLHLANLDEAHRDTAYLRLAFSNFQQLISHYPNSRYAPDAAQRMSYIYNKFAESELTVARWYIKRKAYVAAVNRAKWVFQYYPLSEQVPESIAILAYSHEQLGLDDLAQEYKTLLQINYPQWLTRDGRVKLNIGNKGLLNALSFGKLGRADKSQQSDSSVASDYSGATKTQTIEKATQLQLPEDEVAASQNSLTSLTTGRDSGLNIGLGLPDNNEQLTDQTNPSSTPQIQRTKPTIPTPTTETPTDSAVLPTTDDEDTENTDDIVPADSPIDNDAIPDYATPTTPDVTN